MNTKNQNIKGRRRPIITVLIVISSVIIVSLFLMLARNLTDPYHKCASDLITRANSDVIRGFDPSASLSEKSALAPNQTDNTLSWQFSNGLSDLDDPITQEFNFGNSNDPDGDRHRLMYDRFLEYRTKVSAQPNFISCTRKIVKPMLGEGTSEDNASLEYKIQLKDGTPVNLLVVIQPGANSDFWQISLLTVSKNKISNDN